MGFHTFDPDRADKLDDVSRYRFCSREELHGLLAPHEGMVVADLGSGTGFYTDDVAPYVETLYAVDIQQEMHDRYREKGVPESVELVAADVGDLPLPTDSLDAAFSTMTYHEFGNERALSELARVLRPGGRLVTIDWIRGGEGERGPASEERFGLEDVIAHHRSAAFDVEYATTRPETYACVGVAPSSEE